MKYKLTLIAAFIAFAIAATAQTSEKPILDSGKNVFTSVQIEAEFPGGPEAWKRYLMRNLNPSVASERGAPAGEYKVLLSFLVDKNGNISDVIAEKNPGYGTAEEAIRLIKRGPAWKPAVQNGQNVSYRARQAITFMVTKDK